MATPLPEPAVRDASVPAPYRVLSRVQETADTWTLELEPATGDAPPSFAAGQFNMVYAFGAGEAPISISGDPAAAGPIVHTVRDVGLVTRAICAARPGDTLGVRGPFGSEWPIAAAEGGDVVVVAGGLGLAPLRPVVLSLLAEPERFRDAVLLYGGREPDQLLYRDQLDGWGMGAELELAMTVDTARGDWTGNVGVVTKLIDRGPFEPERAVAMVCGPEAMMRFAIRALQDRGVAPDRIYISIERNMKCALTHCGRCVFGPTYACREGPVLRLADVEGFYWTREI